jgi:hypothetical protein
MPACGRRLDMNGLKMRRPSAALVVAMVALFVALGGTAGAVVTAAVPLAKRALVADNAKKLGGESLAQLTAKTAQAVQAAAAAPGPASTAAGLVSTKTATGQIAAGGAQTFSVTCDAGQKVMGGGFTSDKLVLGLDSYPSSDTTWSFFLGNIDDSGAANVTVYATCLR